MSTHSKLTISIGWFELICLLAIVTAGSTFLYRRFLQPGEVAAGVVENVASQTEEVLTKTVDKRIDRVEDSVDRVFSIADEILGTQGTKDSDPPQHPVDKLDHLIRRGSSVFGELTDRAMGLTPAEEHRAGDEVHQMLAEEQPLLSPSEETQRIERLAQPFLTKLKRPDVKYQFFVVDDPSVNAFAHVGGYVYIHRGLLESAGEDDSALQFVVGHEIAHNDLRHCAKSMTACVRANEVANGMGCLANMAYQAIALGYSEDQELEADLWSYRCMISAGKTHQESLRGLVLLKEEAGDDASEVEGEGVKTRDPLELIANHLRSHPPITARIEQLEREYAQRTRRVSP